jgi:hypothetical protein
MDSLETYSNQFTKVQMQYDAHLLLLDYFKENKERISAWFNVITPRRSSLAELQNELKQLARKEWSSVL